MEYVLEQSNFVEHGHSNKELISVIENLPRDELLQMTEQQLLDMSLLVAVSSVMRKVVTIVRPDKFERFCQLLLFTCLRIIFNTTMKGKIEDTLIKHLGGTRIISRYTQISDTFLARIHIIIETIPGQIADYDLQTINSDITNVITNWEDKLKDYFINRYDDTNTARQLFDKYSKAFSVSYKERFDCKNAYHDVNTVEKLSESNAIIFELYKSRSVHGKLHLKLYSYRVKISLSDIMPILGNMGVNILKEHTYKICYKSCDVFLYYFSVEIPSNREIPEIEDIKEDFETILYKTWKQEIDNDNLNQLVFLARLKWCQVVLLRLYIRYLKQITFRYSKEFIEQILTENHDFVKILIKLFYIKFDTAKIDNRSDKITKINQELDAKLAQIKNVNVDKVLNSLREVINATLRTNFFQKQNGEAKKIYIPENIS